MITTTINLDSQATFPFVIFLCVPAWFGTLMSPTIPLQLLWTCDVSDLDICFDLDVLTIPSNPSTFPPSLPYVHESRGQWSSPQAAMIGGTSYFLVGMRHLLFYYFSSGNDRPYDMLNSPATDGTLCQSEGAVLTIPSSGYEHAMFRTLMFVQDLDVLTQAAMIGRTTCSMS